MGKENPVLVLASGDDPQFAMLNDYHTQYVGRFRVCPSREGCDGDLAMVGDAGVAARIVWDLREGALGTLPGRGPGQPVVSGTGGKSILLTNGRGVFSASLGEFVLAAICISRRISGGWFATRWHLSGSRSTCKR